MEMKSLRYIILKPKEKAIRFRRCQNKNFTGVSIVPTSVELVRRKFRGLF